MKFQQDACCVAESIFIITRKLSLIHIYSYIVLKEDNEKLSKSCRTINSQLQELHKVDEGIAEEDRHYLDDVLGKVLYLFKDSSYSYEQELRVIYQTKENILHTEPKNPEDKPWLFVQTAFPLQLEDVYKRQWWRSCPG